MGLFVALLVIAGCGSPESSSGQEQIDATPTVATDSELAQSGQESVLGDGSAETDEDRTGSTTVESGGESSTASTLIANIEPETTTIVGAEVLAQENFSRFSGKRVGVIVNHASQIRTELLGGERQEAETIHLVDALAAAEGVELVAIFGPEHGFRGTGAAGEAIVDETDASTGVEVFSLYGDTKAPSDAMLTDLDVLVYDLQDVGARYYTYISTMGLAMAAAARNDVAFVVADRPNPQPLARPSGVLRSADQESFVSQYPVPTLYDLTAGELSLAIKGEAWLDGLDRLALDVVEMKQWNRAEPWGNPNRPWVPPSPGLPTIVSALTYPALVGLEATTLSFGQGTSNPFGQLGAPWLRAEELAAAMEAHALPGLEVSVTRFEPEPTISAPEPRFEGQTVPGLRLDVSDPSRFDAVAAGMYLVHEIVRLHPGQEVIDRPAMFDLLAGSATVRQHLLSGKDPGDLVEGWSQPLEAFDRAMESYRLYD